LFELLKMVVSMSAREVGWSSRNRRLAATAASQQNAVIAAVNTTMWTT